MLQTFRCPGKFRVFILKYLICIIALRHMLLSILGILPDCTNILLSLFLYRGYEGEQEKEFRHNSVSVGKKIWIFKNIYLKNICFKIVRRKVNESKIVNHEAKNVSLLRNFKTKFAFIHYIYVKDKKYSCTFLFLVLKINSTTSTDTNYFYQFFYSHKITSHYFKFNFIIIFSNI